MSVLSMLRVMNHKPNRSHGVIVGAVVVGAGHHIGAVEVSRSRANTGVVVQPGRTVVPDTVTAGAVETISQKVISMLHV